MELKAAKKLNGKMFVTILLLFFIFPLVLSKTTRASAENSITLVLVNQNGSGAINLKLLSKIYCILSISILYYHNIRNVASGFKKVHKISKKKT